MADETILQPGEGQQVEGQQQQVTPPPPVIDNVAIAQAVKDAIGQMAREMPRPQPQPVAPQPDPMRDLLAPYVAPVQMGAQQARDAAVFYNVGKGVDRELKAEYSDQIEQVAAQWEQMGRPMDRATIWQWIKGSDDYVAKKAQRDKEASEAATRMAMQGATVGLGSPDRQYGGPVRDASQVPPSELEKLIGDLPF